MDPCTLPLANLPSVWVILAFGAFVAASCTALAARQWKIWTIVIFGGICAGLTVARQECRMDEAIGGDQAPSIVAIITSDEATEFPLTITNRRDIPIRNVILTVTQLRDAEGTLLQKNPFVDGKQIRIDAVAPAHTPIQVGHSLPFGTFEINIVTSRNVYSERITLKKEAGRVSQTITMRHGTRIINDSQEQPRAGSGRISVLSSSVLNTAGIVLSLVGVLILFRYGMPFRVASGGVTFIISEQVDEDENRIDDRHVVLGYIGISLIVIGAIAQMVATWS